MPEEEIVSSIGHLIPWHTDFNTLSSERETVEHPESSEKVGTSARLPQAGHGKKCLSK